MNVLILNGSPRPQGTTAELTEAFITGLRKASPDIKIDLLRAYAMRVAPCMGCKKCRPDGGCVLPEDDGHRFAEALRKADGLVLAAPVYWGNLPGPMKTLFDRIVPELEYFGGGIPKPLKRGNPAAMLVNSAAPPIYNLQLSQSRGTLNAMRTLLHAGGYRIRGAVNLAWGEKPGRHRERALRKAEGLGRRFASSRGIEKR